MAKAVLRIGGYTNTGKTTTTNFIAQELIQNGYTQIKSPFTGNDPNDHLYLLCGKDNSSAKINIVINTASDDSTTINNFDTFLQQNPCDIIITTIRSFNSNKFNERTALLNVLKKYIGKDCFQLEIPLAKINKKTKFTKEKKWYKKSVEDLSKFILSSVPFNLKI
ncbi:MAG: hypothetical protein IKQ13_10955 [Treponema sp.]|nr:hypothetical protein [Treponema sp.]